jgi:methionine-gamma-lyase
MIEKEREDMGFDTAAVRLGKDIDASSMAIHMASTAAGFYTRGGNPTIARLEEALAHLEGGEKCVAAACGMAAVTQTLLSLLGAGDRLVAHRCVYDWSDSFFREELPRFGVDVEQIDFRDLSALEFALSKKTKIVYFEPLSNPSLDLIDVKRVAELAHSHGATVVADNTFLSPYLLRPLSLGVDVVIHSATKYLCGHGDSLGGAIITDEETAARIRHGRNIYGGVLSPFNAFMILRGLQTLSIRMSKHSETAMQVASFLSDHPNVASVSYPGLDTHPDHALAVSILPNGFAGIVGFQLAGGSKAADRFKKRLRLCKPWVSLGDTGSLAYVRWEEPRKGVEGGYVRLSVGLEDPKDIIDDLGNALPN